MDIPAQNETFQIIVRGRVASGSRGDAAIDDLILQSGQCKTPPPSQPTAPQPLSSAQPQLTSSTQPVLLDSSVNCDFNLDKCGWTQTHEDDFNWIRQSGETPTNKTGPTGDNTKPGGNPYTTAFVSNVLDIKLELTI